MAQALADQLSNGQFPDPDLVEMVRTLVALIDSSGDDDDKFVPLEAAARRLVPAELQQVVSLAAGGRLTVPPKSSPAAREPNRRVLQVASLATEPPDRALVRQRRFGLASWLAAAEGHHARAAALRLVAVSAALMAPAGNCASRLRELIADFDPASIVGDPSTQLLVFAWTLRASLIAPHSGAADLANALRTATIAPDDVVTVAEAVVTAARHGVILRKAGDIGPETEAQLLERITGAVRSANRLLAEGAEQELVFGPPGQVRRGPTNKLAFVRALRIWREWIGRRGLLGRLLVVVADDQRLRSGTLKDQWLDTRASSLERHMEEASRRYHVSGTPRTVRMAQMALLAKAREAMNVVRTWIEAVDELEKRREEAAIAWRTGPLADLRAVLDVHRQPALTALRVWSASLAPAAVASGAEALDELFDAVDEGPPAGPETAPEVAENSELLKVLGVRLHGFRPPAHPPPAEDILAVIDEHDWQPAFERRLAEGDHFATKSLIELIAREQPQHAADLERQREQAIEDDRRQLAAARRELDDQLARCLRGGYLDDASSAIGLRIAALQPEVRLDLGNMRGEIDALRDELDVMRERVMQRFRNRLVVATEAGEVPSNAARQIERLVETGDIPTAEESLELVLAGHSLPGLQIRDELERFYPAVPDLVARLTIEEVVRGVADGGRVGPLDFGQLSAARRRQVSGALEDWHTGFQRWDAESAGWALQSPLHHILGVAFRAPHVPDGLSGSHIVAHVWLDLHEVRRYGRPLVPTFGSLSGGQRGDTMRVLLCSAWPGTEVLIEWLQESDSKPVLVLVQSVVPMAERLALAEGLRLRRRVRAAVVDAAVVAWLATRQNPSCEAMMRLVLPFTAINPFTPTARGNVPPEMFFGRDRELAELLDSMGTSFIYGGRQFGKSALMRHAARRFGEVPAQHALYLDLDALGVGRSQGPEAIWGLINRELPGAAMVPGSPARIRSPEVQAGIKLWLDDGADRSMLLLLDDCDAFLAVDRQTNFANVQRLRAIMEATERRCKVVFAGLHQVRRYLDMPNQPLTLLRQGPSAIGPLQPQAAHDLVSTPLQALGYQFESEQLVNRILAYCNNLPGLIQLFSYQLTERMLGRPRGPVPYRITEADVESTLQLPDLRDDFRGRLLLTLELDKRYKVIAFALAYEALHAGPQQLVEPSRLRALCQQYWTPGFVNVSGEEFRALLDEMVDLCILAASSGRFRLRSPYVLRMLGSRDAVEMELLEAEEYTERPVFEPGLVRRRLHERSAHERSPLDEVQIRELIRPRSQVRIVVGSDAMQAQLVHVVLDEACGELGHVFESPAPDQLRRMLSRPPSAPRPVNSTMPPGAHTVRFVDLTGCSGAASILHEVLEATSRPTAETCGVVLLMGPGEWAIWSRPESEGEAADQFACLSLRRWDAASLWMWVQSTELPLQAEQDRRGLLEVTGGWPVLVAKVVAHGMGVMKRLGALAADLSVPEAAAALIREVGLGTPDLARSWGLLAELNSAESADELADLVAHDAEEGAALVRALTILGALEPTEDGLLRCERVLARAWMARS